MNKQFFTLTFFFFGVLLSIQAQSREDSLFLQKIITSSPDLIKGKTYYLEDGKQRLPSSKSRLIREKDTPEFYIEEMTNGAPFSEIGNQPVIFKGIKTGSVKVGTSNRACFILSFSIGKENYCAYDFRESLQRTLYSLTEADFLNQLSKLLVGKTLYTKSANWFQYNEKEWNATERVSESTCKYCPVTITRVVNDYNDKYIVLFKQNNQGKEYAFQNVVFDNKTGSWLNFTNYFTFTNPQESHPNIPQERWEQIMAQNVKKGFTAEEVRIAFGKPDEIYTEDDDETWVYFDKNRKSYGITFKDGIVEKIVSQTSR